MMYITSEAFYQVVGPNYIMIADIQDEKLFAEAYLQIIFNTTLVKSIFSYLQCVNEAGAQKIKFEDYNIMTDIVTNRLLTFGFAKCTLEREPIGEFNNPMLFKSVLHKYYKSIGQKEIEMFFTNIIGSKHSEITNDIYYLIEILCHPEFVSKGWIVNERNGIKKVLEKIDKWANWVFGVLKEDVLYFAALEYKRRLGVLVEARHPISYQNSVLYSDEEKEEFDKAFRDYVREILDNYLEREEMFGDYW